MSPKQPSPPAPSPNDTVNADTASSVGETVKNTLNAHKGKLAIGVAATLGIMVFYNWREKKLAKSDPEEYARLQRLKAGVRAGEAEIEHAREEGNSHPRRTPRKSATTRR